ncbi:hypothetical protein BDZ89DRAFT_1163865 [Hymenopellis radicata]|nr:hypothetical protein BDZ89DRAFT_1163865 [Hymenopellis radicata]
MPRDLILPTEVIDMIIDFVAARRHSQGDLRSIMQSFRRARMRASKHLYCRVDFEVYADENGDQCSKFRDLLLSVPHIGPLVRCMLFEDDEELFSQGEAFPPILMLTSNLERLGFGGIDFTCIADPNAFRTTVSSLRLTHLEFRCCALDAEMLYTLLGSSVHLRSLLIKEIDIVEFDPERRRKTDLSHYDALQLAADVPLPPPNFSLPVQELYLYLSSYSDQIFVDLLITSLLPRVPGALLKIDIDGAEYCPVFHERIARLLASTADSVQTFSLNDILIGSNGHTPHHALNLSHVDTLEFSLNVYNWHPTSTLPWAVHTLNDLTFRPRKIHLFFTLMGSEGMAPDDPIPQSLDELDLVPPDWPELDEALCRLPWTDIHLLLCVGEDSDVGIAEVLDNEYYIDRGMDRGELRELFEHVYLPKTYTTFFNPRAPIATIASLTFGREPVERWDSLKVWKDL